MNGEDNKENAKVSELSGVSPKQTKKNKITSDDRRDTWKEIFKSEMIVEKYNGNTYIGFLGMYIKLENGESFLMNRKTGKWDPVEPLTLQPLEVKGEKKLIDRIHGFEEYGT